VKKTTQVIDGTAKIGQNPDNLGFVTSLENMRIARGPTGNKIRQTVDNPADIYIITECWRVNY